MRAISLFLSLVHFTRCALSAEFQLLGEMMPLEWIMTAEAISESAFAHGIVAKAGSDSTNNFLKLREITEGDAKVIVKLVKPNPGASASPLEISSRVDLLYSAAFAGPLSGNKYCVLVKPAQGEWTLVKELHSLHAVRYKRPPEVFVRFSPTNYVRSTEMAERAQREFLRRYPTHPAARSAPSIILRPGGDISFQFGAANFDWIWDIKLTADHKFSELTSNRISAVTRRLEGD